MFANHRRLVRFSNFLLQNSPSIPKLLTSLVALASFCSLFNKCSCATRLPYVLMIKLIATKEQKIAMVRSSLEHTSDREDKLCINKCNLGFHRCRHVKADRLKLPAHCKRLSRTDDSNRCLSPPSQVNERRCKAVSSQRLVASGAVP